MPVTILTVKIKSGKRTPAECWVEQWYPERKIEFTNGRSLKNDDLGTWIANELQKQLDAIQMMSRPTKDAPDKGNRTDETE